jgi:transposase
MLWYLDEVFFSIDCDLSYTWMPKNARKLVKTNGAREKDYVIGTVCPSDGKTFFLQTVWMDSLIVKSFFQELAEFYPDKKHLIILDNVSYHKCQGNKDFPLPENIELMFLPPYSPELNPIERLWNHLKGTFLNNSLFTNIAQLKQTVYDCLKTTLNQQEIIKSVCSS